MPAVMKKETTIPQPSMEAKRAYHLMIQLLDEFRKVNAEMPTQQAVALLCVADQPGITVTELAKQAGLGLASASRHVEALGGKTRGGLGLLADDYDAMDRRKKVLTLTPKGQRTIDSIVNLLAKK